MSQYEGHSRACPSCQAVTHHAIAAEHRRSILGPRLSAMLLHHSGVMGRSKRDIEETLVSVFELPIGLGTIANHEQAASAALAPIHEAIRTEIDQAPVKGLDETGWKEAGKKRWLWVASTLKSVLFRIHPRRNETALADLLPSTTGIAITDHWKTYLHWPLERCQLCWAHLNRNGEKLRRENPDSETAPQPLVRREGCFVQRVASVQRPVIEHATTGPRKSAFTKRYIGVLLTDGMKHVNQKVALWISAEVTQ
ncbi:MAG: transposase [Gemmataceae bacterium]